MNYSSYPTSSHKYAYFWAKYRPVMLKLMIDSADGPQQYKFSSHEVKSANARQKGHTFELKITGGKAVNNIRESPIAQDLLWILKQSSKAVELSGISTYWFTLDRQYVLHVTREPEVVEAATISPEVAAPEVTASVE
jgi:hypothetical protein